MSKKRKHEQKHKQVDEKNLGKVTGGIAVGGCNPHDQRIGVSKPHPDHARPNKFPFNK